jgi:hypothetical protein
MIEETQYRVLADYEVNDPHPLRLPMNTVVKVRRTDDSWPGWLWVEADGQTGWIAEAFLKAEENGDLRTIRDYDGTELSAKRDQILTATESVSGWIVARSASGETGWFPLFNLRPCQQT